MKDLPTSTESLVIHDYLIQGFGGKSGVRDSGSMEAALGRLTTGDYSDIEEEAAALMESLSGNHPLIDGNKRVSFFVTDTFLRMNGYQIICDNAAAFAFFKSFFDINSFDYNHLLVWLRNQIAQP